MKCLSGETGLLVSQRRVARSCSQLAACVCLCVCVRFKMLSCRLLMVAFFGILRLFFSVSVMSERSCCRQRCRQREDAEDDGSRVH